MEQLTLDQQRIVSENHNLIYSLANKKSINLDEYYDVLAIGLCKAAIAFDSTKGKFSTLAYTVMLNEYKQELRKQMENTLRSSMIACGSSNRGLSDVIIVKSASLPDTSPIS